MKVNELTTYEPDSGVLLELEDDTFSEVNYNSQSGVLSVSIYYRGELMEKENQEIQIRVK